VTDVSDEGLATYLRFSDWAQAYSTRVECEDTQGRNQQRQLSYRSLSSSRDGRPGSCTIDFCQSRMFIDRLSLETCRFWSFRLSSRRLRSCRSLLLSYKGGTPMAGLTR
jgi:hypothetical protein